MLVFMFTFGALENFVAIFAAQRSLPSGSIYFLVMSAMLLLVRVTLGKLVDQRGEAFFVYTCNAAMLVAFLLLALAPNVVTYVASAMLAGYAFGGLEPSLQPMAVHIATSQTRGSANSTFLCGYDIGYGLGGGVAGTFITGAGYSAMWAIMSLAWSQASPYTSRGREDPTRRSRRRSLAGSWQVVVGRRRLWLQAAATCRNPPK